MLSWHELFVSASLSVPFIIFILIQNKGSLQLTLLRKLNYPSSQSLFNASYTTNCTLKVILHHLMYHSVLVLFSQGKSHCFHLLLRRSMPQVTQVGFMVYVVSR